MTDENFTDNSNVMKKKQKLQNISSSKFEQVMVTIQNNQT
jgi:hypothetical protein